MAIERCPECDLLMMEEEARAGSCRKCQARHRQDEASAAATRRLATLAMLVLLTAAVAVGTMWLRGGLSFDGIQATTVDRSLLPQTRPMDVSSPGNAVAATATRPAVDAMAFMTPSQAVLTAPSTAPQIVNDPDGKLELKALLNGDFLKLRGKVKVLIVGRIDGRSILDASELDAEEIICRGNIDGGSKVKLRSPGGFVRIAADLNGESTLEVDAPRGAIWFRPEDGKWKDISINGESLVRLTARHVKLPPKINGTATQIDVTLTKNGELKWGVLAGGSQLRWRKAEKKDPEPQIVAGAIQGSATVSRKD